MRLVARRGPDASTAPGAMSAASRSKLASRSTSSNTSEEYRWRFYRRSPRPKGPAERFTGDVWVDMVVEGEEPSRVRVGVVQFEPCARTAWHRHTIGQTLYVTEGIGLVQARSGEVVVMRAGDT